MKKRLLKTKDSQLHLCPRSTRSDANTLIIIHREIVKRHFNREKRKKEKKNKTDRRTIFIATFDHTRLVCNRVKLECACIVRDHST